MTEPTTDELARHARETAELLADVTAGTHHDEMPCTDVCAAASQACDTLNALATENERLLALVAAQAEQIARLQRLLTNAFAVTPETGRYLDEAAPPRTPPCFTALDGTEDPA